MTHPKMVAARAPSRNRNAEGQTAYQSHKDDFPTPPWAVRAFLKYVVPDVNFKGTRVLEPAAGRGHIVKTLREDAGAKVLPYDLEPFDEAPNNKLADFLDPKRRFPSVDYVITNPPYAKADDFVLRAVQVGELGTALLIQTLWMQGLKRWDKVWGAGHTPTRVGFLCKCMPATYGRIIQKGPAFMSHSWFWWDSKQSPGAGTQLILIPPFAQKELERNEDYA